MFTRFIVYVATCIISASLVSPTPLIKPASAQNRRPEPSTDLQEISEEQAELRQELQNLVQELMQIQNRIAELDQLAAVQREMNQLLESIAKAEIAGDDTRVTTLESRIEPLERHLNELREKLETGGETGEKIGELKELIRLVDRAQAISDAPLWIRALKTAIENLEQLRLIQSKLNRVDSDTNEAERESLEEQIDQLGEQIDEDGELLEMISQFIESRDEIDERESREMEAEITEFIIELESRRRVLAESSQATSNQNNSSQLISGEYFITQSWSQENRYRRPYYVRVPTQTHPQQKFPVFIFLHGNGGNARNAMQNFVRNRRKITANYIIVFAQGYRESWNIVSERSKADDVGFIESIVQKMAQHKNVDTNNFSIMGASNGSALINQIAIESNLPNIRNYISGVSPLNVWQFDGTNFKAKGRDNQYKKTATPMTGKRLMNISGTNDKLVPYQGGPSPAIPAKNGKLAFIAAEESTFIWARQMGYQGKQHTKPNRTVKNIDIFDYLDGDVIHCKVNGEGHNATHEVSEDMLLEFLLGGKKTKQR
jgi:poly(3-hydroxybutyrate) depolymerase/DNA-binding FrmR family transcriptional regulator